MDREEWRRMRWSHTLTLTPTLTLTLTPTLPLTCARPSRSSSTPHGREIAAPGDRARARARAELTVRVWARIRAKASPRIKTRVHSKDQG